MKKNLKSTNFPGAPAPGKNIQISAPTIMIVDEQVARIMRTLQRLGLQTEDCHYLSMSQNTTWSNVITAISTRSRDRGLEDE